MASKHEPLGDDAIRSVPSRFKGRQLKSTRLNRLRKRFFGPGSKHSLPRRIEAADEREVQLQLDSIDALGAPQLDEL
jgi:hypothetical protein